MFQGVNCSFWQCSYRQFVCSLCLSTALKRRISHFCIKHSEERSESLWALYLSTTNQTAGFHFLTNEAGRCFPETKCLSFNSPQWLIIEDRRCVCATVVCLVLILNQSVLKRADGLLINLNTTVVENVPHRSIDLPSSFFTKSALFLRFLLSSFVPWQAEISNLTPRIYVNLFLIYFCRISLLVYSSFSCTFKAVSFNSNTESINDWTQIGLSLCKSKRGRLPIWIQESWWEHTAPSVWPVTEFLWGVYNTYKILHTLHSHFYILRVGVIWCMVMESLNVNLSGR